MRSPDTPGHLRWSAEPGPRTAQRDRRHLRRMSSPIGQSRYTRGRPDLSSESPAAEREPTAGIHQRGQPPPTGIGIDARKRNIRIGDPEQVIKNNSTSSGSETGGQRRRPIARVDRRPCTIQQLIDRRNPTIAHLNSVPLPAAHTRHIAGDQPGQPD